MNKVLGDIAAKNSGIGGILAAMVYQIDFNNSKKSKAPEPTATKAQEPKLEDYFGEMFNQLSIEHCVKETSYRHQFNEANNIAPEGSPYQSIFNESDHVSQLKSAYTFLDGTSLSAAESTTLENC